MSKTTKTTKTTKPTMNPQYADSRWYVDSHWDVFALVRAGNSQRSRRSRWMKLGQVAQMRTTRKANFGGKSDVCMVLLVTTKSEPGTCYGVQAQLFEGSRVKGASLRASLGLEGETPAEGVAFMRKFVFVFDWCVTLAVLIG